LIINELSIKTHETTGNKPAKPEITDRHNMNTKPKHLHSQNHIISKNPEIVLQTKTTGKMHVNRKTE